MIKSVKTEPVNVSVADYSSPSTSQQTYDLNVDPEIIVDDGYHENDHGHYVGLATQLSIEKKRELLQNPWIPPRNYDCESDASHLKRKFNHAWLDQYAPWLVYSKRLKGALCKHCVLVPPPISTKTMAYAVSADETADVAGKEQLSISGRFYDEIKKKIKEEFVGFVELKAQNASAIAEAIDNFLISFNLPTEDCIGFGFDGCSTIAGKECGVQAILRKKYPLALYFHCSSHKLNLVVNDANAVPEIRNTVATVKDVITFFREWTTRRNYAPNISQLSFLEPVVNALQAKSIDMISVGEHIKNIKNILRNDREFPDKISNEMLQKARAIAMDLNMEISVPRLAHKQTHRSKPP
ncbi:Zinc finger MYM-type protein 1 [Eumeta japonica]|uniref:Zinc finger MYM-type protein 1 n=1 Tax=Eumeta variegata TaxID=151549 RepID=A0A4C1V5R7_EUMVA|nr:Zinc finger MYM-type protein 1 [Eumeta japonica]